MGRVAAEALSIVWVELGEHGTAIARIVVDDAASCPPLLVDGKKLPMAPRLPAPPGLRVLCQVIIPAGTKAASLDGQSLPLPKSSPKRIVAFGDTGCRIKDQRVQNCNDENAAWPFRHIASSAAEARPDLIIHVGDYLYRESPCPVGMEKLCGGTPSGDNWDAWNADFFTPAAKLLAAAPWVFARGNHESCARSWRGWFYYLDPRDWTGVCELYSKPYATTFGGFELAIFDSSEATDDPLVPEKASTYAAQLATLHARNAWIISHVPFWGFKAPATAGPPVAVSATLAAAWNQAQPGGISLIVSGHVHLFEFVSLKRDRPPQLVAGDGGTQLAAVINSPENGTIISGATVAGSQVQQQWGYTLLTRAENSISLELLDSDHRQLVSCKILAADSSCSAVHK